MLTKKHHPLIFFANLFIFFAAVLLHTSEIIDISIKNATPILLIPLLTAFSVFSESGAAAVTGFICGAFLDSVTSGAYCFNTAVLMLIGFSVSCAANSLFNRNVFAAAVLSLIASAVYFILVWLVFHAIGVSVQSSLLYLLSYALPSAIYTAVFIFPFYFLYKHFYNCVKTRKGVN